VFHSVPWNIIFISPVLLRLPLGSSLPNTAEHFPDNNEGEEKKYGGGRQEEEKKEEEEEDKEKCSGEEDVTEIQFPNLFIPPQHTKEHNDQFLVLSKSVPREKGD
jgi:hypothetical protein